MAMENTMTQWVNDNKKLRGNEQPSKLDQIIKEETDEVENVNYLCPKNKSDHILTYKKETDGVQNEINTQRM